MAESIPKILLGKKRKSEYYLAFWGFTSEKVGGLCFPKEKDA